MRKSVITLAGLAVLMVQALQLQADQDTIGPVIAVAGQSIDLFFPNQVLPTPSRKVLQFTGMAEASGLPGAAILGIHFDYVDVTGATVIIPLPNFYQEAVQTGAGLVPINAGPVQLPYCPAEVSIHFENLTPGTEILFQGIFDHTCVPIPEPATWLLVLLGGIAASGLRRLR